MARTAVELGLMQGAPPPPERLVTSDNWIEGPFNRWGFLHVRELARTARIPRGDGPVLELPHDPRDLGSVPVPFEGSRRRSRRRSSRPTRTASASSTTAASSSSTTSTGWIPPTRTC